MHNHSHSQKKMSTNAANIFVLYVCKQLQINSFPLSTGFKLAFLFYLNCKMTQHTSCIA